ncbi:hypothetical protein WA577_004917, partial [Blastocystis sp. JDR]
MSCQVRQWLRDGVLKDTSVAQRQLLFLLGGLETEFYAVTPSPGWLTVLSLSFWYFVPTASPVETVLDCFLKHTAECVVDSAVLAVIRLFMRLRSREPVDFAAIFDPRNFSDDIQDNTLAWELCAVLRASQPAFIQPSCFAYLTTAFIEQLVEERRWERAVFVMLFNPYDAVRTKLVRDLIHCHIPEVFPSSSPLAEMKESQHLLSTVMATPAVAFLVDELGISPAVIYSCLADHARYVGDVLLEVVCRVAIQEWDASFELLLKHILPEAVIGNNVELVATCLSLLEREGVKKWRRVFDVLSVYVRSVSSEGGLSYEGSVVLFQEIEELETAQTVVGRKEWVKMLEEMKWRVAALIVDALLKESDVDEKKVEVCALQVGSLRCSYDIQKQLLDSLQ